MNTATKDVQYWRYSCCHSLEVFLFKDCAFREHMYVLCKNFCVGHFTVTVTVSIHQNGFLQGMISTCRKSLVQQRKKSREYEPPHFFNIFLFTSFCFSKISASSKTGYKALPADQSGTFYKNSMKSNTVNYPPIQLSFFTSLPNTTVGFWWSVALVL